MVETKCVGLKTCARLDIMWMFGPSVANPEPHGSKITCQIRPLAAVLVFIFRTCTYTLGEILSMLDCCSPWRTWTSRRTAILVGSWCCCSSELLQHHGWAGRILSSRALSPSHRLHMQTKMSETFWNILMFPRYLQYFSFFTAQDCWAQNPPMCMVCQHSHLFVLVNKGCDCEQCH